MALLLRPSAVGPVDLFVEKSRPILPALAEPHHAVVLVRLLCDEGVIGARSTSGREGPVVGRAVRNTGSRPLLIGEIAEHWSDILESCLLRWALQDRRAALQASATAGAGVATGTGAGAGAAAAGGGGGSLGLRDELLERARLAFRQAQSDLAADDEAAQACLSRLVPHRTVVEALKGCSRPQASRGLLLTSTLPPELGLRVLDRCGLELRRPQLDAVFEPDWAACVSRVVERAADAGTSGLGGEGPSPRRVQLVTGNLARLEALAEGGLQLEVLAQAPASSSASSSASPSASSSAASSLSSTAATTNTSSGARAAAAEPGSVADAGAANTGPHRSSASASTSGRNEPSVAPAGVSMTSSGQRQASAWQEVIAAPSPAAALLTTATLDPTRSQLKPRPVIMDPQAGAYGDSRAWSGPVMGSETSASPSREQGEGTESQSGTSPGEPEPALRCVYLASWAVSNMSFRARALSAGSSSGIASLLSETQLAEKLQVMHLDVVMDGVAWRR
ncbi:hypothetical protein HYH03_008434 [Edaphochlamys debaryana]|uniref:Uncharacterized protein n=1 Tax=Edaphochlamys debaryana TaxID=47281 RepID=A0A835Y262_9CHLO|nr:hypothetical protein HYH03_008434 [Edaphochlamys debaryana]|eukprot:KAG2493298.1 hypothetical protein HYH03_008434 [Edaphochlamys debaryana]